MGQSRVLVVRGEAGVGKTALLDHVAKRTSGCNVLRGAGVESEMELAFAGLHQLCAPMLGHLDRLPGPQRDALSIAFGLISGEPPDRFLVGLAVLSLLAELAEQQPLVCLVDDAQWLDRVSAQTLAFVGRRLLAERVALVFAVRQPTADHEFNGLDELKVAGLNDQDARALLDSVLSGPVDSRLRDRIVAETRGNPLALLELTRGMTPAELAGGFGLEDAEPLMSRIEQGFLRQLEGLPASTRRLMLVAAVEPIGDVTLFWSAAQRLGIGNEAAAPAVGAGLIEIGTRIRFRHPLLRSAARQAAGDDELRRVHSALAEVTDPQLDPDRRAWHRAHAALGPDEGVAQDLMQSAGRAQSRGGDAAAGAFLSRATELTPDAAERGLRALAAAQAKWFAADPQAARELLTIADGCPLDPLGRARLQRIRAQLAFAFHPPHEVVPMLMEAAKQLEPLDLNLARETQLDAIGAVLFASRLGGREQLEPAVAAVCKTHPHLNTTRVIDPLLDGLSARYSEGYAAGVPKLKATLDVFTQGEGHLEQKLRWLWLATPVAHELWDDGAWDVMTRLAVSLTRRAGALTQLPVALIYRALSQIQNGEFDSGAALILEADSINQSIGNPSLLPNLLIVAAWKGDETLAVKLIDEYVADSIATGAGRTIALAEYARALLYNSLGQYDKAVAAAQRSCEFEDLGFFGWGLTELVEACVRSDQLDLAAAALSALSEHTLAADTDWALGIEARSRAMLRNGPEAEDLYLDAIDRLGRTRIRMECARACLVYGEWLRREGRRIDARTQLRRAHDMFTAAGAEGFAERTRRELMATGETVRKRNVETVDELTPQESQIARLAADGHTNPEIGAELFISARTVEWHLRKVYAKLGVGSRRELAGALQVLSSRN